MTHVPAPGPKKQDPLELDRRTFLASTMGTIAAMAAAGCDEYTIEDFLQKQFRELKPDEVQELVARLEARYSRMYGKDTTISTKAAMEDVLFGYGLDLSRCVGCRRCVYACVEENNQSRDPQIHWIRVLEQEKEKGMTVEGSNAYYDYDEVPREGHFYIPVACQQCRKPQCTRVCPVGATYTEPDGIVVVDYDWCIGCRCCMAACPYGARHFNWGDPTIPPDEYNPVTHYLGNRPRPRGVVEKCTYCVQRVREGRYPACLEVCPVGARKFGNLLDPKSEMRVILETKRVFVLKAELHTEPTFYYFYAT